MRTFNKEILLNLLYRSYRSMQIYNRNLPFKFFAINFLSDWFKTFLNVLK